MNKLLTVILILAAVVGVILLQSWVLMLVLGALASTTGWPTAIPFWGAFFLAWAASLLFGGRSVSHFKR